MLRSVWEKKRKKKGGGYIGHDPMYLCFYDHNFPYVVTRFIFNAAVVWGCQVVETKIYFRFRHSTRPPSCRGKISAAHFPANV
jgi:hypothetical protein